MSLTIDPTLRDLNDCGCCEGITAQTPIEITNLPGLTAIAYRVGTHAQFKQSMLARLSASNLPALRNLAVRDNDDFTIALLDAWATVADVLTFYQERLANEFYLRTATERISLLYLARLIGYELRPGVAASTYLAFTLEDAPGAPRKATIDIGTKVQSIPGQGEQPQIFETIEKIEARAEWNAIKPRMTQRHPIKGDMDTFFFEGITTGLSTGDGLLIIPDNGKPVFRQVEKVTLQPEQQRTLVQLQQLLSDTKGSADPRPPHSRKVLKPDPIANNYFDKTIRSAEINALAFTQDLDVKEIFDHRQAIKLPPPTIFAFRTRASIFGHNAPPWDTLPSNQRYGESIYDSEKGDYVFCKGLYKENKNSWVDDITLDKYPLDEGSGNLYLDNIYSNIVKNSFIILINSISWKHYKIKETSEISTYKFTLTAKVSRLTICAPSNDECKETSDGLDQFKIRTTTVFAQSEELTLSRMPYNEPVSGKQVELDSLIDGLSAGQTIIVCGELYQNRGVHRCETATISYIEQVLESDSFTRIILTTKLDNDYVRDTVTINANVARATHGETVEEVLGSGDASQPYQHFTLRQPPLTYVSAPTPSGAESTLKIRINDLQWHEAPTLYGYGSSDHVFVTRTGDDDKTTVQFGDGQKGMRLATGQENVRAIYRKGIGLAGNVDAGQLSMLMTRPLGVKGAINPLAANGGADRESLEDARQNAQLTVLTLDRIVSLQDFEDFARAFAGVAKALATWTWNGQKRTIFVTIAGPNGAEIDSSSDLYKNLLTAMQKAGDPYVPVYVESYRRTLFRLEVRVKINPDYSSEKVLAAVEKSLRIHFSFNARSFGQPVVKSEVMAVIQAVPGVEAACVDKFYRYDPNNPEVKSNDSLAAALPQAGANETVSAAEMLTLDTGSLKVGVMQ